MISSNPTPAFQAAGDSCRWFVGYTKPRQEARAIENLRRQGFDCHAPLMRVQRRIRREVRWLSEPMFPRYVFLRPTSSGQGLDRVRSTLGMADLVRFAGTPAAVANSVVNGLLALGEGREIRLFSTGDAVRFVDGTLAGLQGAIERMDGDERVVVLIEFLRREQRLTVPASQVERMR